MTDKKLLAVVSICVLSFSVSNVFGQGPLAQNWEALKTIPVDEKLAIQELSGKEWRGKLKAITDASLELERRGKAYSYKPVEVRTVWRFSRPSKLKRGVAIGAGVVAGMFLAGAVSAAGIGCGGPNECGWQPAAAITSAIVLPIAGGFVGRALVGDGERILIYGKP
jgi:hypothetical protein